MYPAPIRFFVSMMTCFPKLPVFIMIFSLLSSALGADDQICSRVMTKLIKRGEFSSTEKIILKLRKKRLLGIIMECRELNCSEEQLDGLLKAYLEEFKAKLKGHTLFTSVFIFTGLGVSYLGNQLPGISGQLQILLFVLYHGLSSAFLNKKYAQLAKWGYNLKSGAKKTEKTDTELDKIYLKLRNDYDLTEEEARDSLVRALNSIAPPLLSLHLNPSDKSVLELQRVIAITFINLRILHRQIEPNQESLIRTIRGYLGAYTQDINFKENLVGHIKTYDKEYSNNLEYYEKLLSSIFYD